MIICLQFLQKNGNIKDFDACFEMKKMQNKFENLCSTSFQHLHKTDDKDISFSEIYIQELYVFYVNIFH